MELYDSMRPILFVQRFFRYSVVIFDKKKGVKTSRRMIFSVLVMLVAALLLYIWIIYSRLVLEEKEVQIAVDKSLFSTVVGFIPVLTNFVMTGALWIAALCLRNRDVEFFEFFVRFDKSMEHVLDLQTIYYEFRMRGIFRLIMTFAFPFVFSLPFYLLPDQGSFMFNVIFISTTACAFQFYGATVSFTSFVSMISDRLDCIALASKKVVRAIDLVELLQAEKQLTLAIQKLNESVCIKHSFVLITNWLVTTLMAYMLLVNLVFWTPESSTFIGVIIPTLIPHLSMVLGTFYFGEFLEVSVSSSTSLPKLDPFLIVLRNQVWETLLKSKDSIS